MRTPFVAGNWKMNMTIAESRSLVEEMSQALRAIKGVEKVLCPPFMSIFPVAALLEGSDVGLGAQNMYWEEKGSQDGGRIL
jgi:triosephosphate isomerase